MLKIGITGGIGVGKTMVCKVFEALNIPVYYADLRTRYLQRFDDELIEQTKLLLGDKSYDLVGNFDRNYVASQVFSNPDLLTKFNAIVHPKVFADFEDWCTENEHTQYVVKESALMFETGFYKKLDFTILITCPLAIRVERIIKRDPHRSKQEIEAIIAKQMPEAEKMKLATYSLENDGKHLLLPQILLLDADFKAKSTLI